MNPDSLGSNITINLPAGLLGKHYRIVHTGDTSNKVIVTPAATEKLFGDLTPFSLKRAEAIDIHFETTDMWW